MEETHIYNQKEKIVGISKIKEAWKKYNVEIIQVKLENGTITGTFEGVKKMDQSNKKITNQDLMNLIVDMKKDIDKRFEDMKKDINKINAKIDLMIQAPTMNKEIDHEALAKINAR